MGAWGCEVHTSQGEISGISPPTPRLRDKGLNRANNV